jgi:hypothetical protein
MSQVLYLLEDCGTAGVCTISDAYNTSVYWMVFGEPVIHDEYQELSKSMMELLVAFTMLWIWWIVSLLVMVVSVMNSSQILRSKYNAFLDTYQISLL